MDDAAPPLAPLPPPPPRRRPSRVVAWSLATGIALAVLVAVALTWVRSEHAFRTVLDEAVARLMADIGFARAGDAWKWRGRRGPRRDEAKPQPSSHAFAELAKWKK